MITKISVSLIAMMVLILLSEAQAQTVLVPDFRVDDAPVGVAVGPPGIQRLSNNNFVITWTDLRDPDRHIYASIYSSAGNILRDDYRIDDGASGSRANKTGSGGITMDSSGNFFVTWLNTVDLVTYTGRIRKFLPNGDPAGASVNTRESGTTPSQVVQASKGKDDKIIIEYGAGGNVYYRFFDNNLAATTNSIQVNQSAISGGGDGLASDLFGNFMISWPGTSLAKARLYDTDGNPRTNEFSIESSMSGADYPRAVYNKDGHFIVVWWSGTRYGMGRIMDGDGNPLTPVFYLGPAVAEPNERWGRPSVDADAAGNFIIAYEYSSDTSTKRIYGTIYGTNGDVIRQFFPISQPTSGLTPGVYMDTDVAYLSQGQFVTVWNDGRNGSGGDIYAAILKIDGWEGMTPIAEPGAIALIIAGLGWIFRRRTR